jgi:hypothetical protein
MCALSGLIVAFGLSLSDCPEATQPGFNDMTGTDAKAITLSKRRNGFEISCVQEMQLCIRRAEALCKNGYQMIDEPHKRPRVQAYVDGKIQTIKTDNPDKITIECL